MRPLNASTAAVPSNRADPVSSDFDTTLTESASRRLSPATALLDAGVPIHRVAERIGDAPAILLRHYTKRRRSKAADDNLANAIGTFAAGFLGTS